MTKVLASVFSDKEGKYVENLYNGTLYYAELSRRLIYQNFIHLK